MASGTAEGGLAGRYANALFELAQEQKAVDAVSADLASLSQALETSPDLTRLVRSPVFSAGDHARALKAVLEKMGAGDLATKFVLLLAGKRRLFVLTQAITAYEHLVAKSRGETEAEVTAARALSASEISTLKSALKASLGKEPRLHTKVDPSLLGGLVVKVGSRMIDSSLRTKLDGLRSAMKGN
ncbi:MAG: F0F1 ATP synthase subunit delta [Alphaproteobacteria bacterium]|nr:F0F1 ATP synthase subunit delta [Alphaproteobacteria bacterium]